MEDKKIRVNEKEMTQEEFNELNKKVSEQTDIKMVKISENTYKTRVEG